MKSLWIYILPEHVWKAADTKDWEHFTPPLPLVGSGPYTVTSWNPNGTTVMERNPYFRRANTGPERVLMTYYGDGHGAVTDLEQNRLDVMPSDTLDVPGRAAAAAHERRARLPLAPDRPRVLGLQPRAARHLARAQERRPGSGDPHRAGLGDRPLALVQASLFGYGAPGNTQLSRSYGRFSLDLWTIPSSATTTTRARAPHPRAGRLEARPRRRARKNGVRAGVRARLRGRAEREARRHADPRLGARRRHRDRRARLRHRQADQPRVQQGRRQADARLRHRDLVDRRRPDARVPALAVHEGADRRLERLRLRQQEVRAALPAGADRERRGGARQRDPHAAAHRDEVPAVHRALRGRRHRRRQHAHVVELDDAALAPGPAAHRVRLRHDHRAAAGPARIRELPGRAVGARPLGLLAALALGSSFLARRREQREPIEIADAPA